jgi:hypothetical protein
MLLAKGRHSVFCLLSCLLVRMRESAKLEKFSKTSRSRKFSTAAHSKSVLVTTSRVSSTRATFQKTMMRENKLKRRKQLRQKRRRAAKLRSLSIVTLYCQSARFSLRSV